MKELVSTILDQFFVNVCQNRTQCVFVCDHMHKHLTIPRACRKKLRKPRQNKHETTASDELKKPNTGVSMTPC